MGKEKPEIPPPIFMYSNQSWIKSQAKCEYCGTYGDLGKCENCGAPNRPVSVFGDRGIKL